MKRIITIRSNLAVTLITGLCIALSACYENLTPKAINRSSPLAASPRWMRLNRAVWWLTGHSMVT
jgi:hypothetical protein